MSIYIYVDDIREDDAFFNHTFDRSLWTPIVCRTAAEAIRVIDEFKNDIGLVDGDAVCDGGLGSGNRDEGSKETG